ncbi:MAG: fibronectin type III domain-containing protein [Angustibacter sp.]
MADRRGGQVLRWGGPGQDAGGGADPPTGVRQGGARRPGRVFVVRTAGRALSWVRSVAAVAAVVVAASVVGGVEVPGVGGAARAWAAGQGTTKTDGGSRPDRESAVAAARESGAQVEVSGERSETTTVWANPDGTVSVSESVAPVRVRRDGQWVPVDVALVRSSEGWVPRAAQTQVVFSAGGDGPAVRLADGARAVALQWARSLPEPRIDGAQATYPLDATTDLVLTALADGFEQKLVLRAPPKTTPKVHLPFDTAGLTMREAAGGGYEFVDDRGEVAFTSPRPQMWDSAQDEAGIPSNRRFIAAQLGGAGDDPHLDLSPSMAWLSAPGTRYPVTIDPTVSVARAGDTYIRDNETAAGVHASNHNLGVGYTGSARMRALLRFDDQPTTGAGEVVSAQLRLWNYASFSCTAYPVSAYPITKSWSASTLTWANQPTVSTSSAYAASSAFSSGYGTGCADGYGTVDVTKMVDAWATGKLPNHGLQLRASETDAVQRKYFCSANVDPSGATGCAGGTRAPTLTVTYGAVPTTPTSVTVDGGRSAGGGTYATTATPTFTASGSTVAYGDAVKYEIQVHSAATASGTSLVASCTTTLGAGSCSAGSPLTDGAALYLRARAVSAVGRAGSWSGMVPFRVALAPSAATDLTPGSAVGSSAGEQIPTRTPTLSARVGSGTGPGLTAVFRVRDVAPGSAVRTFPVPGVAPGSTATLRLPDGVLTGGRSSTWDVQVRDDLGQSATSSSRTITVLATPAAPAAPTLASGNGRVTVSWAAPNDDGGSPVTGYTVTVSPGGAATDAPGGASRTVGPDARSVAVAGLANGTSYTATVRASNALGAGAASAPSVAVAPRSQAPDAPAAPVAAAGDGQVTVAWQAPADDGGAAITGYRVTTWPVAPAGPATVVTVPATGTGGSTVVSGLTNGTSYAFTVAAVNPVGVGASSPASPAVTPRPQPPGAPGAVTTTGGDRQLLVRWAAPQQAGSSAVTDYVITAEPGGHQLTVPASATAALLVGLANDVGYTVSVAAASAAGTGQAATATATTSAAAPTFAAPSAPIEPWAAPGDHAAMVSWSPPASTGDAGPVRYLVRVTGPGVDGVSATPDTTATIPGLAYGSCYTFAVTATNDLGDSPPATFDWCAGNVPAATVGVQAHRDDAALEVAWTRPADHGSPLTGYRVTAEPGGHQITVAGDVVSARIVGLTNGQRYTVTVTAINAFGVSPPSAPSAPATPTAQTTDTDRDGLPDLLEDKAGTSDTVADTDHDGLTDGYEVLRLTEVTSPTDPDSDKDGTTDDRADTDGDGLTNAAEQASDSDPVATDTDGDDLDDRRETTTDTSATRADTDSDGVADGIEVEVGLDPTAASGGGVPDADRPVTRRLAAKDATAHVRASAGLVGDLRLEDTGRPEDLPGAVTAATAVTGTSEASGSGDPSGGSAGSGGGVQIADLTVPVPLRIADDAWQRLRPFAWDHERNTWKLVDNDVSISSAGKTVTIDSPELGLRYAVVDLDAWRNQAKACVDAEAGRPPLDLQIIVDNTVSTINTGDERLRALRTVLGSLRPGDRATYQYFTELYSHGQDGFSYPYFGQIDQEQPDSYVDSIQRITDLAGTETSWLRANDVVDSPDDLLTLELLLDDRPNFIDGKPYDEMPCGASAVLYLTDGETSLRDTGFISPVPVHVLDVGVGGISWLYDMAESSGGTYSFVPTAGDVAAWIDAVQPKPRYYIGTDTTTDTDGDGLTDWVETNGFTAPTDPTRVYTTDPHQADTDGDGLSDGDEAGAPLTVAELGHWPLTTPITVHHVRSAPTTPDGDGDGLPDVEELEAGLPALVYDTDRDGLSDGEEADWGTNPLTSADTDADGYSDAHEAAHAHQGHDPTVPMPAVDKATIQRDVALGFFCGDNTVCRRDSLAWLTGNIASGLLVFGDVRDTVASLIEGRYGNATILAAGMIPLGGDALATIYKVTRFGRTFPHRIDALAHYGRAVLTHNDSFLRLADDQVPGLVNSMRALNLTDETIATLIKHNGAHRIAHLRVGATPTPTAWLTRWPGGTPPTHSKTPAEFEEATAQLVNGIRDNAGNLVRNGIREPINGHIRYPDIRSRVSDEISNLHEVKSGRSWGFLIKRQAYKDAALREHHPRVDKVYWHFYIGKNGKIGPSRAILHELDELRIPYFVHWE